MRYYRLFIDFRRTRSLHIFLQLSRGGRSSGDPGRGAAHSGSECLAGGAPDDSHNRRRLGEEAQHPFCYRHATVTEIRVTSPEGFEVAIEEGIERPGKSFRDVQSPWVKDKNVLTEDGTVRGYGVNLEVPSSWTTEPEGLTGFVEGFGSRGGVPGPTHATGGIHRGYS